MQTYEGKPALTWWQGRIIKVGFGEGEDVIYNSSYQPVATVRAGNGYQRRPARDPADPAGHRVDRRLRPDRTSNLSSVHGSAHGILLDSIVEEIDIKTGLVMWEWHALGHIPLRDSLNHVSSGATTRGITCTSTRSRRNHTSAASRRT